MREEEAPEDVAQNLGSGEEMETRAPSFSPPAPVYAVSDMENESSFSPFPKTLVSRRAPEPCGLPAFCCNICFPKSLPDTGRSGQSCQGKRALLKGKHTPGPEASATSRAYLGWRVRGGVHSDSHRTPVSLPDSRKQG